MSIVIILSILIFSDWGSQCNGFALGGQSSPSPSPPPPPPPPPSPPPSSNNIPVGPNRASDIIPEKSCHPCDGYDCNSPTGGSCKVDKNGNPICICNKGFTGDACKQCENKDNDPTDPSDCICLLDTGAEMCSKYDTTTQQCCVGARNCYWDNTKCLPNTGDCSQYSDDGSCSANNDCEWCTGKCPGDVDTCNPKGKCDPDPDPCDPNPCAPHGTCTGTQKGCDFECTCDNGWTSSDGKDKDCNKPFFIKGTAYLTGDDAKVDDIIKCNDNGSCTSPALVGSTLAKSSGICDTVTGTCLPKCEDKDECYYFSSDGTEKPIKSKAYIGPCAVPNGTTQGACPYGIVGGAGSYKPTPESCKRRLCEPGNTSCTSVNEDVGNTGKIDGNQCESIVYASAAQFGDMDCTLTSTSMATDVKWCCDPKS